jgi:hypothetical protein
VVLHFREQDAVPGLQIFRTPRVGHQVDALRRPAREHDLVRAAGIDELRRAGPGRFKGRCRPIAQLMDSAVHVGVVAFVVANQRVDHGARFLAGRRVVEIDQRFPVDLLIEDREVGAQGGPVW